MLSVSHLPLPLPLPFLFLFHFQSILGSTAHYLLRLTVDSVYLVMSWSSCRVARGILAQRGQEAQELCIFGKFFMLSRFKLKATNPLRKQDPVLIKSIRLDPRYSADVCF